MNVHWLGIISAILSICVFASTYRLMRVQPTRMRLIGAVIFIAAAIPAASFSAYYLHLIPGAAWFYRFRSLPGTEFLIIFTGIAGGMIASLLPRPLLMVPFLGALGLSMTPFLKPILGPIPEGTLDDQWDGEVCLQSTPSTCGAASTATILRHFGIETSEETLAAEAFSYRGGTEAWYLARSFRRRGLTARFVIGDGFDTEMKLPAIIGVRLANYGHFIAILGQQEEQFIVGDPLQGRELLTKSELLDRYFFTGFRLEVSDSP